MADLIEQQQGVHVHRPATYTWTCHCGTQGGIYLNQNNATVDYVTHHDTHGEQS